eukprot:1522437-Amphidinium_carterae.2
MIPTNQESKTASERPSSIAWGGSCCPFFDASKCRSSRALCYILCMKRTFGTLLIHAPRASKFGRDDQEASLQK